MTPAWLRWAATGAILIFHPDCEGQSHKTVSTDHNFWRERRAEADSNRRSSAYQPDALPLGQTGSHPTMKQLCRLYLIGGLKAGSPSPLWCVTRSARSSGEADSRVTEPWTYWQSSHRTMNTLNGTGGLYESSAAAAAARQFRYHCHGAWPPTSAATVDTRTFKQLAAGVLRKQKFSKGTSCLKIVFCPNWSEPAFLQRYVNREVQIKNSDRGSFCLKMLRWFLLDFRFIVLLRQSRLVGLDSV